LEIWDKICDYGGKSNSSNAANENLSLGVQKIPDNASEGNNNNGENDASLVGVADYDGAVEQNVASSAAGGGNFGRYSSNALAEEATGMMAAGDGQKQQQQILDCPNGWLNFANQFCYFSIEDPQLPFYYGRQQCGKFGANFSSVHSMAEFQFIMEHFDLHHLWIGIFYGADRYEDHTDVEQQVLKQFTPLVPWSDPSTPKGFICKAEASAFIGYGNNNNGIDIRSQRMAAYPNYLMHR
jgi:hypothetical protein